VRALRVENDDSFSLNRVESLPVKRMMLPGFRSFASSAMMEPGTP
jgi:hypothetical protein